ncbi:hypothetical protein F5B17DRAFT_454477 [Nemania serpens]|nr:hypothetical protein F5B17DRAFT_454477 [Nemania serpens]
MRAVRADPQCRGLCLVQQIQDPFVVDDYCVQHEHLREEVLQYMHNPHMQQEFMVSQQGMYSNELPIDGFHANPMGSQTLPSDTSFGYMGEGDGMGNGMGDGMVYDNRFPSDFYAVPNQLPGQFTPVENTVQADDTSYISEPINEALQVMAQQDFWTPEIEAALKAEVDAVCEALRNGAEEDGDMDDCDSEMTFTDLLGPEEENFAEVSVESREGSSHPTEASTAMGE